MLENIEDKIIEILKQNLQDVSVNSLDKRFIQVTTPRLPAVFVSLGPEKLIPLTGNEYETTIEAHILIETSSLRSYREAKIGAYKLVEQIFALFKNSDLDGLCEQMKPIEWTPYLTDTLTFIIDFSWEIKTRRIEDYAVILLGYTNKIAIIKKLRVMFNLSLREALNIVNHIPSIIIQDISYKEAERIKYELESVGGTVEIRGRV